MPADSSIYFFSSSDCIYLQNTITIVVMFSSGEHVLTPVGFPSHRPVITAIFIGISSIVFL